MTPSPASPALDAKGLSKERVELAPCPFCGDPMTTRGALQHVAPGECLIGSYAWGGEGAVARWNRCARERAEPVATLDIFDGRSTTYLEDGAFKLPDGKHALYAASPPVAVRATADMVKRARECLANAKVTGENPTSQRALEYRLGELLDALDTPASSVVDEGMGQPVRDLIGAAKRVYDKLASETASVNILDQEALGVALAALTPGVRP